MLGQAVGQLVDCHDDDEEAEGRREGHQLLLAEAAGQHLAATACYRTLVAATAAVSHLGDLFSLLFIWPTIKQ